MAIFHLIHLLLLSVMGRGAYGGYGVHMAGQSRNYFVELVLSFHLHMGSQDRTQAFAAGSLLKVLVTVPSAVMKYCDQKPLRECMAPIDSCI